MSEHTPPAFYETAAGEMAGLVLRARIRALWPSLERMRTAGIGYAMPYLDMYREDAERCLAVCINDEDMIHWPPDGRSLVCRSDENALPLETESVDRILAVHALEHAEVPAAFLREIWRVLKGNGQAMMIVPSRSGLWARAEWSPFGHGRPYSPGQLRSVLKDSGLQVKHIEPALFMLPSRSRFMVNSALGCERVLSCLAPALGGVHIVTAEKRIYATPAPGGGTLAPARARRPGLVPKPAGFTRAPADSPGRYRP